LRSTALEPSYFSGGPLSKHGEAQTLETRHVSVTLSDASHRAAWPSQEQSGRPARLPSFPGTGRVTEARATAQVDYTVVGAAAAVLQGVQLPTEQEQVEVHVQFDLVPKVSASVVSTPALTRDPVRIVETSSATPPRTETGAQLTLPTALIPRRGWLPFSRVRLELSALCGLLNGAAASGAGQAAVHGAGGGRRQLSLSMDGHRRCARAGESCSRAAAVGGKSTIWSLPALHKRGLATT
jgi:hypothetical protein